MSSFSLHTVRNTSRKVIAAGMFVLYLTLIVYPPVAYVFQGSGTVTAGVRECSGDCNICGCSPESRASHTCCCAKKRQQEAHAHQDEDSDTPDCCKKEQGGTKETVIACGCPCGSKDQTHLSTGTSSEVLPFCYSARIILPYSDTSFSNHTDRLTSRYGEPPDPPPKLIVQA
jgi:hypothetical protein